MATLRLNNKIKTRCSEVITSNHAGGITATILRTFLLDLLESILGFVYLADVTGYTGGADTDLDSIDTADVDLGTIVAMGKGKGTFMYELVDGTGYVTDTESSGSGSGSSSVVHTYSTLTPYVVLPLDYDPDTNNKVWKRTDIIYASFTDADLDGRHALTITHNTGVQYGSLTLFNGDNDAKTASSVSASNALTANTYEVIFTGAISGTWKYVYRP